MDLVTKPLDATTWPDFARLAEDHRGVWAGCWCLNFHAEGRPHVHFPEQRRELKEARVRRGQAHAALVYDGTRCVGWCQFGPPGELPRTTGWSAGWSADPAARSLATSSLATSSLATSSCARMSNARRPAPGDHG